MDQNLIARFLNDQCTEQDQRKIYRWLVNRNKEHKANAFLKKHWESIDKSETLTDTDLQRIYHRMLEEIQDERVKHLLDQKVGIDESTPKTKSIWVSLMKYAAIIIFVLSLGYFAFNEKVEVFESEKPIAQVEKATSPGQKSHFILKDGSKIILNSDSKILFDEDFGVTNRNITLEGEAFFEVVKNKEISFNVTANNTVTTAIGTSFNISAFKNESSTAISLASGRVKILSKGSNYNSDSEVLLEPGQEFLVDANNDGAIVRDFDLKEVLSWKDNILFFDNTDMLEIVSSLERWYNVKVIVLNPQKMIGIRGTGQFKNESLDNVLKVLSYSLQFSYQMKEDKVTITF